MTTREACLLEQLNTRTSDATIGGIQEYCESVERDVTTFAATTITDLLPENSESLITQRRIRERIATENRLGLTPHLRNYVLPMTYSKKPNGKPYETAIGDILPDEHLNNLEAKFQISLKTSIANSVLLDNDEIFIGFTALSFWQALNSDLSAPFRETNYEPEIFWIAPLEWKPFDVDSTLVGFGLSHQSNGRGGFLSRSWNRVYGNFVWEENNFVFNLKAWWRVPEDKKTAAYQPSGDDNPDIEKYMGNFEFSTVYRNNSQEISALIRNNLRSDNKGYIQLEWTFPLWKGVRGFAQYSNGYGESLIDYDAHIERFGVGVLLSDLL